MKTTLPTLSEVVDITANMAYDGNFITNHIWDYNDFLKQPLKLEMFIPCKDGVPLEEPTDSDYRIDGKLYINGNDRFRAAVKEYQQAKERVIFKGFEIRITKYKNIYSLLHNGDFITSVNCREGQKLFGIWKKESISDLTQKVELTDNEFKRLGL